MIVARQIAAGDHQYMHLHARRCKCINSTKLRRDVDPLPLQGCSDELLVPDYCPLIAERPAYCACAPSPCSIRSN